MISTHNKSVNVNRGQLLNTLKTNLATHEKDHKEAVLGYKVKLLADLQEAIIDVNMKNPEELKGYKGVVFQYPPSYAEYYQEIIDMLEMSVDENINLDSTSFQQYVKNKWAWSSGFEGITTQYKSFAAAAKLI